MMFLCKHVKGTGQSEPAATNAPVGRSVHWMEFVTVHFLLGFFFPFLFGS
jgi:hypothetical protein